VNPRRTVFALIVALAVLLLPAAAASAAPLKAGAARADITPATGGTTLGYVRPDITVKGVHTRLLGRALVLDDGDSKVAILATDLAFALEKESLVARVKDLGFTHENILYTGTHTHSGPEELAHWQVEQLAQAIRRADARKVPARAAWGGGRVEAANRNRSIEAHLANFGMDLFYGQGHPEDAPGGADSTRDTRLRVLRVERTDGTPLAAWMEFPVHLTTSTPGVDLWDSDLAGASEHHLEQDVGGDGFVALWSNGSSGDLMPRFDSYNPTATMDLLGRRIAAEASKAWRQAGGSLSADLPLDQRWTRPCYCGQEVEAGRRVSPTPVFGLPFLGGSEDGASIFHEPVGTEGRRLPAEAADPVQGRKIQAVPSEPLGVHEKQPEVQVLRIGDRVLLAAPGEPSVEMGRRFEAAVQPHLPAGVRDVVVVGLANDYLGYFTTPEEYDQQHYEGGHTVFGKWTSLLARDAFVGLTRALASGGPAPAPSVPGGLGGTDRGTPDVGGGGPGRLLDAPTGRVERMSVIDVRWQGAEKGADRPLDAPFLTIERRGDGGAFAPADSDLGLGVVWREADGEYTARYDVPPALPAGTYRVRVTSRGYDLRSAPFAIAASDDLRALGVTGRAVPARTVAQKVRVKRRVRSRTRPRGAKRKGCRRVRARRGAKVRWSCLRTRTVTRRRRLPAGTELVLRAQHPAPDPDRAILFRDQSPAGGTATLRVGGRTVAATWSPAAGGWVGAVPGRVADGTPVTLAAGALRDGAGNVNGAPADLRVGTVAPVQWPPNMGVGGGRTPGPGGQGTFPP
jgi:neutral ceramidase